MFTPDNAVLYVGREHSLSEESLNSDKLLKALRRQQICNPDDFEPVNFINDEEVKGKVILGIPPKPYLAVLADACVAFPHRERQQSRFSRQGKQVSHAERSIQGQEADRVSHDPRLRARTASVQSWKVLHRRGSAEHARHRLFARGSGRIHPEVDGCRRSGAGRWWNPGKIG